MKKENVLVMLSNGHGSSTIGKQSADGSLREYAYVREIRKRVQKELEEQGYNVFVVTPEEWDVSLKTRVQRINNKYAEVKKKGMKAFCISIHVNAAGSDGKWHNATGWSAFVSNNASQNSKNLSGYMYDVAESVNLKVRKPMPKQKFWQANLYICKNTDCPCVLTENFFMDNEAECKWLLSENGKKAVTYIHVEGIKKYIANL